MEFPNTKRKNIDRGSNLEASFSRFVSPDLRKAVFERDNHQCVNCGDTNYLEIDHAIPIAMSGSSCLENLQVLCRKCNSKKRDKQWWGKTLYQEALRKLGSKENLILLYERTGLKDFYNNF